MQAASWRSCRTTWDTALRFAHTGSDAVSLRARVLVCSCINFPVTHLPLSVQSLCRSAVPPLSAPLPPPLPRPTCSLTYAFPVRSMLASIRLLSTTAAISTPTWPGGEQGRGAC